MSIAENIAQVKANMERAARNAGRDPKEILLVGATKMNDAARVKEAIAAGLPCCGENRVQELLEKHEAGAYAGADLPVIAISALTGEGLGPLESCLAGETVSLSGQSGVGKSTLTNSLLNVAAETGEISKRILRGRNTTRHAELFRSSRFSLMDTPGFSLITLSDEHMEPILLQEYYPEFAHLKDECRFTPCWHQGEPGCRVRAAVAAGEIDESRYARYAALLRELDEAWRNRYA